MLGVVYLARAAEGLAPVKRFAESYRTHAPGADHSLIVICKGHRADSEIEETRRQFGQPVEIIAVSDDGFDIGAYINAAQALTHERLCFLNSFTEIAVDNWLGILDRQLRQPGTGIAGATGSFESVRTTIDFVAKAAWLCLVQRLPYNPDLADQFQWVFEIYAQPWLQRRGWQKRTLDQLRFLGLGRLASGTPSLWREHWKAVTGYAGDLSAWLDGFPEFPNPHIRSNGFIVRREIFNRIVSECQPTKESAMHFESGVDGYTARIRQLGLKAEVVDKDGAAYDVSEWPKSRTFRLGDQGGLILTDNQSRNFDAMSSGTKATHARVTWGDYSAPAPDWFRDLGFSFMKRVQASTQSAKA
jgi:hypothetical protein